jgi:hypothetical protein
MSEGEPSNLPKIIITTPQERVAAYSFAAAERHDLDSVAAEHLRGYGNVKSRIRQIRRDFEGTTTRVVNYPGWTGGLRPHKVEIEREEYQEYVTIFEAVASHIYSDFLSKTEKTRSAAREVDVFIEDALPRFDVP